MWDLPRPGLEPGSPALAGGFLTTVPPGKSPTIIFLSNLNLYYILMHFNLSCKQQCTSSKIFLSCILKSDSLPGWWSNCGGYSGVFLMEVAPSITFLSRILILGLFLHEDTEIHALEMLDIFHIFWRHPTMILSPNPVGLFNRNNFYWKFK